MTFPTSLGWMALVVREALVCGVSFGHDSPQAAVDGVQDFAPGIEPILADDHPLVARLQAYAAGEVVDFSDVAIDVSDRTPFARRVLQQCQRIPYGRTLTYGQLAARAGVPGAARAVGNVMAANRCPLLVPCHRVVASGARPGGFSAPGGTAVKLHLLEMESAGAASQRGRRRLVHANSL